MGSKETQAEVEQLRERLEALEKSMSTLLLRFGEQEQELNTLHEIVMGMRSGDSGAPVASVPTESEQRVPITPAMANVLKLVHLGQVDEAKAALSAIPAAERDSQPAILALVAAALCIARDDFAKARVALDKARQLTDDARLLKVIELMTQKLAG